MKDEELVKLIEGIWKAKSDKFRKQIRIIFRELYERIEALKNENA